MQLSKKYSVAGLVGIISGILLHPEGCVSLTTMISKYVPVSEDTVSHTCILLGTVLLSLSTSILKKAE